MDTPETTFVCPHCRRPVYDRRRADCGYCGQALPEELKLSPEQVADFARQRAKERRQVDAFKNQLDVLVPDRRHGGGGLGAS